MFTNLTPPSSVVFFTSRRRSLRQGIVLHLSVSRSVHRRGYASGSRGYLLLGLWVCLWVQEGCLPLSPGSVYLWIQGVSGCAHPLDTHTLPPDTQPPTGMLSCFSSEKAYRKLRHEVQYVNEHEGEKRYELSEGYYLLRYKQYETYKMYYGTRGMRI